MTSFPLVGIIVLNWNGWADTRECLNSLFRLAGLPPKIYVVDNGSNDDSVRKLREEFRDRIELIANSRNLLYAGGNNVGILRALADGCSHLLLLNNDTVVDGGLIEELMRASDGQPDAVLCPKIYYADQPQVLWYAGGKLSLRRARVAHRGIRETDRGQYDRIQETAWATGCALFAPRHIFEKVGLLDESFELYSEDLDYCLRAKMAGFRILYIPAAKVWHKVSSSIGGNLSQRKIVRKWKSLRRLLRKHLPNPFARFLALSDFVITESFRVFFGLILGRLR
jgi:GT2 family glycosyltransferase